MKCRVLINCLSGFYQILQSLSGTFSLVTLLVIAAVTFHSPVIGGVALAAFATVVPSILAYAENKETLQAAAAQAQQAIANSSSTTTVITSPPAVVTNITNTTNDTTNTANTGDPTNSDLPPNGQT
jgi:hypothetical protein